MDCLLGIDIGTTSLKAVAAGMDGAILAVSSREYYLDVPAAGHAEQDPAVWWNALKETVREILAHVPAKSVKGVGFSGQMHGLVALDKAMRPVRKAILHCDVRSQRQCDDIEALFPNKALSRITMNPVFPGMQLISLLWMRDNEPALFERVAHVLCPKDYIRFLLTGEIGTERTDASGTCAYDTAAQRWAMEALEKLGVERALFPSAGFAPYDAAGTVSAFAAAETGLPAGIPVAYGGGDQSMQSVGNGLYEPGSMTATIGTSGQVMRITREPVYNEKLNTHVFCHVLPGVWFGMGGVLNAGVTLNWFRRNFAQELTYEQMSSLAADIAPGSGGLVFFPAMMGERTPYLDAATRGMFLGATFAHTKAHFIRAIMEGVTFEMKSGIDILNGQYAQPEYIVAAGGAAKSPVWLQMQADIYAKTICVKQAEEQACMGAAIMAGIASGAYRDVREGCEAAVSKVLRFIEPIPKNADIYARLYDKVFRHQYDRNIELMRELAAFDG